MRPPAPTSGTTRPRPATPGTTPPRSRSSSPSSPSTGSRGRSRCRRRRTGSSTSSIAQNGQLISAQAVSADVADERHAGRGARQLGVRRRRRQRAVRSRTPRRATVGTAALVRPGPVGRAQLAPDVVQPADRVSCTCRRRTWRSATRTTPAPVDARRGSTISDVAIDPLPDDAAVRAAIKSASKGMLLAWDPIAQTRGVAFGPTRPLEWRDTGHGRRAGVPGHRRRPVPGAGREDGQDAVVDRQSGRDAGRSDQLRDRRRAVRRGAWRLRRLVLPHRGLRRRGRGPRPQRARVRLQARWHGASRPVLQPAEAADAEAARDSGQRGRLQSRARSSTNATARCATAWPP